MGRRRRSSVRGPHFRSLRRRLWLEPLEERRLLAITVTTNLDVVDPDDGFVSLREAIELANANPGADVIDFDPALWAEGPATILLEHGELLIRDSVTINGPGAELLTIDASGNDPTPDSTLQDGNSANDGDGSRVFLVNDFGSGLIDVRILGLTLTGGDAAGDGGAVKSTENLSIVNSVIRDNIGSHGGGIHNSVGSLNVQRSTVSNNAAFFDGGGIVGLNGDVNVVRSMISGNATRESGGGIEAYACDLTVTLSTISGNRARVDGGGIDVVAGSLRIAQSTVSENEAGRHGGGIIGGLTAAAESTKLLTHVTLSGNRAKGLAGGILGGGKTTIWHSTIAENVTDSDGTGDGSGGGVFGGFGITVQRSIVANNWNFDAPEDWASEQMPDVDYTLIEHVSGIHPIIGEGNILGQDPMLGALVNNGGPTKTHALLPGSPAIDAGDPAAVAGMNGVPEFDQRGGPWSRVVNGDDVPEARIDMGAVEWQLNPLGGDYNFDGVVDAADYSVWRDTLGSTNDLRADGSSATTPGAPDGVVDEHDYAWWKVNFGNVMEQGAGSREPGVGVDQGVVRLNGGSAAVGGVDEFWSSEEEITAGEGRRVAFLAGVGTQAGVGLQGEGRSSAAWQASSGTRAGIVHRDAALLAWVARRSGGEPRVGDAGVVGSEAVVEDHGWESLDEVFATLVCLR